MPEYSVKKPLTIFCATIAIIVLGLVAYTRMTPDLLPNMDFPYIILMTTDPGASPERVEAEITKPIEQSMATLENIKSVSSNSSDNYSLVVLEFEEDTNLDTTAVDIQQKISILESGWDDMVGTPYVLKINPSMMPVANVAVSMEGKNITELSDFVENTLMNRLEGVPGVARVSASGCVDEQLHVVISQERIDELNEQIAGGINKQMDKVKNQLNGAKREINSAIGQLSNIGSLLPSGKPELDAATAKQIAELEAEKLKLEGEISKLERIQRMKTPDQNALDAWRLAHDELQAQLDECNMQLMPYSLEIESIKANPDMSDADKAAAIAAITAKPEYIDLNAQRLKLEGEMKLLGPEPGGKSDEEIQAELDKLGYGITFDQIDGKIAEINAQISPIKAQLDILYKEANMINPGKIELNEEAFQELLGKLSGAASQALKGIVQMSSAMSQIDGGLAGIEGNRNQALSGADLNNILSLNTVSQILSAQNFSMPAGYVEQDGINYMVSVGEEFRTVEDLEGLLLFDLGLDDVPAVYLGDVADIFVTDNADTMYTRLNNDSSIMLAFEKQSNHATTEVSEGIRERLDQLEEEYDGLKFFLLMDQGDYILYIVDSIMESLLFGALFSVLVLFFFLRDVRPTLITLCSIPLSVMFAIVLMYFTGIGLNIISLSALSIAVGMLVDNAVVVIENIYRLRTLGANGIQAAVSGSKQVAGAIIASTLTTICVFMPIVFVDGLTRQLFTDMAITMAYALIASLIMALTLVPAMASKMLKDDKPLKKDIMAPVYDKYRFAGRWALNHKAIVFGLAVTLLIGSAGIALGRGFTFMPDMDSNMVTVTLSFDENTTMEEAADIADEALLKMTSIDEVDTVGATMGSQSMMGMGGASTTVTAYVLLPEGMKGSKVAAEIEELCADLPCDITSSSAMMDTSMITGSGVTIHVYSNNMESLQTAARDLAETMRGVPGIASVSDGLEDAATALHVNIDRNKAMEKGYTTAQIFMELSNNMTTSTTATTFELGGMGIDVIVESPDAKRVTKDNLLHQTFTTAADPMGGEGEEFTLADIATVEETTSLTTINREGQQRYLTVVGELEPGYNVTKVSHEVQQAVNGMSLPGDVTFKFSGENEAIMDAINQMILLMLLGLLLVYFVMVAQFQSLKSPFIVMFTIPLAFTGGFLALLITGMDVSIISLVGFVMLMGIIVNNGIVLVDYINQLRMEGWERREAIIEAGVTRIRPILMTSITTILGLLVMALGKDMGTAMMQPVAVVCIGGLIYATLMTLFVVPCIYDVMNKKDVQKISEDDLVILDI